MNFCLNNELFSKTNHHDHHKHKEKSNESNICRGYLTDKDFRAYDTSSSSSR